MPYAQIPAFVKTLQRKPSFGRPGLERIILSCVRSQELRFATWDEFDLGNRLWTVPAEHIKRNKAHIAPLSDMALAVLKRAGAYRFAGTDLVFPGVNGALLQTLVDLGLTDDWQHVIDSTSVRGHVSAAGGKGGLVRTLLVDHAAALRAKSTHDATIKDCLSASS